MTTRRLTLLLLPLLPAILGACKREATAAAKAGASRTIILLSAHGDRAWHNVRTRHALSRVGRRASSSSPSGSVVGGSIAGAPRRGDRVRSMPPAYGSTGT